VNGGQVYIVNATNDTVSRNHPVISVINASLMALTPDKTKAAVFAATLNTITVVDTQSESPVATVGLSGPTESMVAVPIACIPGAAGCSSDEMLLVAEPTAPFTGSVQNGIVQFVDLTAGVVTASIPVPQARRIVLNHTGTKALVFSDD